MIGEFPRRLPSKEKARRVLEKYWQEMNIVRKITVHGRSMGDTLPSGCEIEVYFGNSIPLYRGEIIYFRRRTKRIIHRLILVCGPWCIEKGDALLIPWVVRRSDVIGVYVSKHSEGL